MQLGSASLSLRPVVSWPVGRGAGRGLALRNSSDFAICDCYAHRGPRKSLAISETLHCDLRVRGKVARYLRFRAAISGLGPLLSAGFLVLAFSPRKRRNR